MYQENNNLFFLKFIVYSMGILLVGGVLFLGYLIYQRNQAEISSVDSKKSVSESIVDAVIPQKCEGVKGVIRLPQKPKDILMSDSYIAFVTSKEPGKDDIQVLDVCNQKLVNRFEVHYPEEKIVPVVIEEATDIDDENASVEEENMLDYPVPTDFAVDETVEEELKPEKKKSVIDIQVKTVPR